MGGWGLMCGHKCGQVCGGGGAQRRPDSRFRGEGQAHSGVRWYMRACMGALELGHGTTVMGGMGSRVREAGSISPWHYLSRLPLMGRGGGGRGVVPSTLSRARPVSHGWEGGVAAGVKPNHT